MQSWTEQVTDGAFLSVAILGETAYFLIRRGTSYFLECFDEALHTDSGRVFVFETAQSNLSGLSHLEGKEVVLTGDGIVLDSQTVSEGVCTLPYEVSQAEVGLPFEHDVVPLPPVTAANDGNAPVSSCRLVRLVMRLVNTKSLEIDTGTGIHQEIIPDLADYQLDSSNKERTQDFVLRSLGWIRTPTQPLWEIKGSSPQPFKLVSVTSDIKLGG